jgi:Phosphotransferase enzyme family
MVSGAQGRGDSEVTRALQRAAPPAEALAWVAAVTGARSVESVEPMPGGASLAMHRVTVTFADGDSARLVLRRYVRADQVAHDPAVAAHEALVLELVERIATPTPRLIGVDPTGEHAGAPAVLMTELPGRPQWAANQRWMRQLVEVLIDVHAIDAAAASGVRSFAVYAPESCALPKWATKPAVWDGRSRSFTARSPLRTARSFTVTSTPATCCGNERRCRVSSIGKQPASAHLRWTSPIAGSTCCIKGWTPPRCLPANGSSTAGGRSTVGLTSPRSSGCSTRVAGIRPLTADSSTSRPCCNAPSMKSTAHKTHSRAARRLTITRRTAHRAGDMRVTGTR